MARYSMRLRRFLLHTVLHADDGPHEIALGVGLATLVAFLPLPGLQTIIAIGLAALFRANKAVCVPVVWITNPATWWPIYMGCWALGRALVPTASASSADDVARMGQIKVNLWAFDSWKEVSAVLVEVGKELWIGCAIVGVFFGLVSYFLARWGVSAYRERRRRRILKRNLLRSQGRTGPVTRRSQAG